MLVAGSCKENVPVFFSVVCGELRLPPGVLPISAVPGAAALAAKVDRVKEGAEDGDFEEDDDDVEDDDSEEDEQEKDASEEELSMKNKETAAGIRDTEDSEDRETDDEETKAADEEASKAQDK